MHAFRKRVARISAGPMMPVRLLMDAPARPGPEPPQKPQCCIGRGWPVQHSSRSAYSRSTSTFTRAAKRRAVRDGQPRHTSAPSLSRHFSALLASDARADAGGRLTASGMMPRSRERPGTYGARRSPSLRARRESKLRVPGGRTPRSGGRGTGGHRRWSRHREGGRRRCKRRPTAGADDRAERGPRHPVALPFRRRRRSQP